MSKESSSNVGYRLAPYHKVFDGGSRVRDRSRRDTMSIISDSLGRDLGLGNSKQKKSDVLFNLKKKSSNSVSLVEPQAGSSRRR